MVEGSRHCIICGAKLASDNPEPACSCHPRYNPRHDPLFGDWLLRTLRRRRATIVHPLEQLRREGKVCETGKDALDCVHGHVKRLRAHGHVILGCRGRTGGLIYVCGPNERIYGEPARRQ